MMKPILFAAAAIAVTIGSAPISSVPASSQEKVNLRLLSGWDDRFEGTKFIGHTFAKLLEKESNGRITVTISGPEVIKPRQQFQPVSSGAFDLLLSTPSYSLGTTGVLFALYAMPPDSELWRKEGYWEYIDKEFGHFNQKAIALVSGGSSENFYQIVLKEPLGKGDQPLKGRKIRGNVFYKPLVEPLGGSLVNLDGGEIYSALEKGVVDGAAWPVVGAVNFKFYEVSKFMMRPRFGLSPFEISMNLDRFKKLSKADQELVLKVGRMVEEQAPKSFDAAAEQEVAKLKELGMKETTLDPALFEKVNKGFLKGVWELAINFNKKTKDRAQAFYEMAKKNGHAPE